MSPPKAIISKFALEYKSILLTVWFWARLPEQDILTLPPWIDFFAISIVLVPSADVVSLYPQKVPVVSIVNNRKNEEK